MIVVVLIKVYRKKKGFMKFDGKNIERITQHVVEDF